MQNDIEWDVLEILDADCWQFNPVVRGVITLEAAELYERHIALLEGYMRGERVLH